MSVIIAQLIKTVMIYSTSVRTTLIKVSLVIYEKKNIIIIIIW